MISDRQSHLLRALEEAASSIGGIESLSMGRGISASIFRWSAKKYIINLRVNFSDFFFFWGGGCLGLESDLILREEVDDETKKKIYKL